MLVLELLSLAHELLRPLRRSFQMLGVFGGLAFRKLSRACEPGPSQRCLLSRLMACLISSTMS